ncbi:MAG TPA: YtcA family lipoprotein [Terracidiphilus sp.]
MNRDQPLLTLPAALLATALTGCSRAPTFNFLGSFFPSWLICLVAGIVLAAIAGRIFARFALDKEILWPVVVYPCLALFFACALWLILFS